MKIYNLREVPMKRFITLLTLISATSAGASSVNGFDLEAYGFIKASSMYADSALASYNNINLSAPTHAAPETRPQDKTSRMGFQTAQSRFGVNMKKGDNLSAKLEFDLIDFNKSSPTTQMNPRVRIAAVTYAWDNKKVVVGQDWDMFSPVTSFTFDYVGLFFNAGNTGFMRQQVQYLQTHGEWELGGALGMAGNNPGVTDGNLETAKSPTYAVRLTRKLENGRVGISGIYARLKYEATGENGTTHDSYAGNAFYEQILGALSIKSEAYYGQNLNNIGTLAIGKGTQTSDVKEFGGTLTGSYKLTETNSVFGGVGLARIDNKATLTPFVLGTTNVITSPGIASNLLSRVGWEHKITPDFSWITEFSRYETKAKIADNNYQLNIAYGLETGIQLRF